jgi:hypothetical protein
MQHSLTIKTFEFCQKMATTSGCDILMGTLHCAEAGMWTPCNNCMCVRKFCLIWMHVSIISCFLMEMNDCHTRIPCLNWMSFVVPCVGPYGLVMIRWKGKSARNITIQSLFCWQTPSRACSAEKLPKSTASLSLACTRGSVGPGYLWLIGTAKV